MGEPYNQQQWGQSKFFAAGTWSPGQPRDVLNIDAPRSAHLGSVVAPRVRTLICGIENNDTTDQRYILRWRLAAGVGGARVSVDFDATRYTRVVLPYEEARLSLVCDPFPAGGTDVPAVDVTAFAFAGDGFAEASMPGPMFSAAFLLVVGQQLRIPIPVGANRFRVVGVDDGTTPFRTGTIFYLRAGPASTRYALPGLGATPGVGDMFGIFNTDGFVPIASGATELVVVVGAGVSNGFVQFGLDL